VMDSFSEFYYPPKNPDQVAPREDGAKAKREAMLYPGYLFIKMNMNGESWDVVMKVARVISFVGANKLSPVPLTEAEYQKMIQDVSELAEKKDLNMVISVGDTVKIKEGSFQSLMGKVVEVDPEKQRIGITLKIFDRETTLDLDWSQVDKITQPQQ
jgi:transcriptional antiterminator NusG